MGKSGPWVIYAGPERAGRRVSECAECVCAFLASEHARVQEPATSATSGYKSIVTRQTEFMGQSACDRHVWFEKGKEDGIKKNKKNLVVRVNFYFGIWSRRFRKPLSSEIFSKCFSFNLPTMSQSFYIVQTETRSKNLNLPFAFSIRLFTSCTLNPESFPTYFPPLHWYIQLMSWAWTAVAAHSHTRTRKTQRSASYFWS